MVSSLSIFRRDSQIHYTGYTDCLCSVVASRMVGQGCQSLHNPRYGFTTYINETNTEKNRNIKQKNIKHAALMVTGY